MKVIKFNLNDLLNQNMCENTHEPIISKEKLEVFKMSIKQTNIEKEPLFILKLLLSLIVIPLFYWFVFLFAKSFVASSTQIVLKAISLMAIKNIVTYYFLPGISILSGMTNTIFLKPHLIASYTE